jgi:hypothetical protein
LNEQCPTRPQNFRRKPTRNKKIIFTPSTV